MLRKKYHVVRKKTHVVRKLFYVASIFGGANRNKDYSVVDTIGSAPSSFNGGLFFALASLGNNGRNHPNKLACFGWLQIKHAVFDCKVHKQKPHVKVGLFRMVTQWAWPVENERV